MVADRLYGRYKKNNSASMDGENVDSEEIEGWDKESERAWKNDTHDVEFPTVVVEALRKLVPEKAHVLDAGAGIGKHVRAFTKLGYIVTGVEQSKVGANYSRVLNPEARIFNMRIQEMTFNEEFDLIHTSAVLQHSLHERKVGILQKFHAALKLNGCYLCTENTLTPENVHHHFLKKDGGFEQVQFSETATDGYSFTEQGWINFMAKNNFRHVRTILPWPYYFWRRIEGKE